MPDDSEDPLFINDKEMVVSIAKESILNQMSWF